MTIKNTIILFTLFLVSKHVIAQQTIRETILHNNVTREYRVYVPEIYDGSEPVPMMFNFHGFTGNANGHLNSTRMKLVADTANFILVSPQGSLFFGRTHWNVGSWTNGSTADDLGFTEAMIDALAAQYNIDLDRVYSCGYSNGGYFSFELACQLSDRIAAIGAVGGKMSSETFNACDPSHPIPVVSIHGTNDEVVTYTGSTPVNSKSISQVNAYWTDFNNTATTPVIEDIPNTNTADGSTVEYTTYENGDNCVAVDHYKVIGGGHDWPGAWGNKDIDASAVIWNFVSQYDINGLISCNLVSTTESLVEKEDIKFYPNPANNLITIENHFPKAKMCHIYSMMGERLLSTKIGVSNQLIDVSSLPANIYLVKIDNEVAKLIVSR